MLRQDLDVSGAGGGGGGRYASCSVIVHLSGFGVSQC